MIWDLTLSIGVHTSLKFKWSYRAKSTAIACVLQPPIINRVFLVEQKRRACLKELESSIGEWRHDELAHIWNHNAEIFSAHSSSRRRGRNQAKVSGCLFTESLDFWINTTRWHHVMEPWWWISLSRKDASCPQAYVVKGNKVIPCRAVRTGGRGPRPINFFNSFQREVLRLT